MSADATGRSVISYVFIGVVDFICLLMAAESYHAGEISSAVKWLVAGIVSLIVGALWPKIRRLLWRKRELDILWKPGEITYYHPYELPPGNHNLQYRIAVVNNTDRTLTNVRVTLDKLSPHALQCVPCNLVLMNNRDKPYIQSFSLAPHGKRFVDLMLQSPNCSEFWIFHTVTETTPWKVPAQAYSMTIRAESDDAEPISRTFELENNGSLWNLRDAGIGKSKSKTVDLVDERALSEAQPIASSRINIRQEWHRLEQEFSKYSSDILAMFEFYEDDGGGVWSILGAGDSMTRQALEATIDEAGNLLLHSSFRLPQTARETDARDRWMTTAAALTEYPIEWSGGTTGTAVRHSKTAAIKKIAKVSEVACKQLAAMDVEKPQDRGVRGQKTVGI
jgi:hypothetical protein